MSKGSEDVQIIDDSAAELYHPGASRGAEGPRRLLG